GDLVTFRVNATDNGCYTNDTLASPAFLMIRDSTPATPLVSLIGNQLVAHASGHYTWYYTTINPYVGSSVISGATSQIHHPATLGYYYATKDTGNCPSLPSNIIYISLLKVNNLGTVGDVKLYPNPSSGMLNIDWNNGATNMQ